MPRTLRVACALEIPFILYEQVDGLVPEVRNLQIINIA